MANIQTLNSLEERGITLIIILLSRGILHDPPIPAISYTNLQARDYFLKQAVDTNDTFSRKLKAKHLWMFTKDF